MRVSAKIIIPIIVLILILFAGFFALTDELDLLLPGIEYSEDDIALGMEFNWDYPEWSKPVRWFKSNSGGMALHEEQSRFAALRNKYALAVNFVHRDELPDYLIPYYSEDYLLEVRILYKEGEQQRTQWIFRDANRNTRLNAVFLEPESEFVNAQDFSAVKESTALIISDETDEDEQLAEEAAQAHEIIKEAHEIAQGEEAEDETEAESLDFPLDVKNKTGFLEIFNEESFLTSEYRYYENGKTAKTEYSFNKNLLVKAEYFEWGASKDDRGYKILYVDNYRYNRSLSLRNIERVFYSGTEMDDPIKVAFPRRIMDLAQSGIFISERFNIYPEFFGDVYVDIGSKMIFDTDNRGRIMSQTLYDSEDKVIWIINNIWQNNRIVSSVKTEGDTVLLAEFAYNSGGDVIQERNLRNGVLERVVRAQGDTEIEELYMNDAVVLRAVWESGRKISETRVRN